MVAAFSQIQSPRHVLSELLQNADDVDAKHARASIVNGQFIFEHDGKDFDEDNFASLCRFGFSNKRKLHTIGFRGIGFKSTFSLGDTVKVLTPSLAVSFNKWRFTEPMWIDDAPSSGLTRIEVKIQDQNRETQIRKNLDDWVRSPASLLFFNSIRELTINDVTLRKDVLGLGPVMDSEWVRLTSRGEHDLLVIHSPEESFPEETVTEIRQERSTEDLHLPPCRVDLVVGLPGEQRLYVVLPTGVKVGLPFSCNAPFLQDPSRKAIKDLSTSPTNRWLLGRLGNLVGNTLCNWLQNELLSLEVRADAYHLLPENVEGGDSIEADATMAICRSFAEATSAAPLLLTTEGFLIGKDECIAPPQEAYAIWSPTEILKVFGKNEKHVLCELIPEQGRRHLDSWDRLNLLGSDSIINRLNTGQPVPRPQTSERLLKLWCFVQKVVQWDFGGQKRSRLSLVPVEGKDRIFPANDVVRLPLKKESISDEAWDFLSGLVLVIDRQWGEYLRQTVAQEADLETARQLLRDLQLERPSDVNEVIRNACRRLFAQEDVGLQEYIRIAHLMAALDARAPAEFLCVTRDGRRRKPGEGVIAASDTSIEELFPAEWCMSHFLQEDYFRDFTACANRDWQTWVTSPKSGFFPFTKLEQEIRFFHREDVRRFIASRQGPDKIWFYAQMQHVDVRDYDFDATLIKFMKTTFGQDPMIWARVLERILRAPSWYWEKTLKAHIKESNYTHARNLCDPVQAGWIVRFSSLPCLSDTQGSVRAPAELYLRTPETEPLMDVEPFVRAELDTEATKPLLRLLGVRDTPAGLDNLISRIRALSGASDPVPLLHEIIKWYGALDKVLARCDSSGLKEARETFRSERFILTSSGDWTTSAEVFQHGGEDDLPDTSVVHPSVQDLAIWSRLGVADRPSIELILDWLNGIESSRVIDSATFRRVRSALQRYPIQVWESCRHWPALDGTWTPVDRLRFRLTMQGLTKWRDLFPVIKSRTANLQMLSAEACQRQPFSSLFDLGATIEYRLSETPRELSSPVEKAWIVALAQGLQRVKLADETQTQRLREIAARLGQSVWQPFITIGVTPYIDDAPAGLPHSPEVLWHEKTLFVREGRLAKSFDALVSELTRPFANESVTEAIKACIERDGSFITEYLEEHFDLEEVIEPVDAPVSTGKVGSEEGREGNGERKDSEPASGTAEDGIPEEQFQYLTGEEAAQEKEEAHFHHGGDKVSQHSSKPRQEPLFNRYAKAMGFSWDYTRQRFVHPDGTWIERCESPFHWRSFDLKGNVINSYWSSQQCLTRGGVEIAAELWELIRSNPGECRLILVDEADRPRELAGKDLIRMKEDKVITLYPAKYRIREGSEA